MAISVKQYNKRRELFTENILRNEIDRMGVEDDPFEKREQKVERMLLEGKRDIEDLGKQNDEGFRTILLEMEDINPTALLSCRMWMLMNKDRLNEHIYNTMVLGEESEEEEGREKSGKTLEEMSEEEAEELVRNPLNISEAILKNMVEASLSLYERKNYEDANKAFSLMVKLLPIDYTCWLHYGLTFQQLEKYDEATMSYTIASLNDIDNPYPHVYATQCYKLWGVGDGALHHLNKAIQLCGEEPRYTDLKSFCEKLKKHVEEKG